MIVPRYMIRIKILWRCSSEELWKNFHTKLLLIEKKGEKQWTEKGQKEKVSYCYFQSAKEFTNSFPREGQEFISKDRNNWTTSLLNYDYSKPYHGLHFQTFLES